MGLAAQGLHQALVIQAQRGLPQVAHFLHLTDGDDKGRYQFHQPPFERSAFTISSDSDLAQLAKQNPRLHRVLPDGFAFKKDTWVTLRKDLRNSPRCRVTFDALVVGLQRYVQA